jgi:hypothetical protein
MGVLRQGVRAGVRRDDLVGRGEDVRSFRLALLYFPLSRYASSLRADVRYFPRRRWRDMHTEDWKEIKKRLKAEEEDKQRELEEEAALNGVELEVEDTDRS